MSSSILPKDTSYLLFPGVDMSDAPSPTHSTAFSEDRITILKNIGSQSELTLASPLPALIPEVVDEDVGPLGSALEHDISYFQLPKPQVFGGDNDSNSEERESEPYSQHHDEGENENGQTNIKSGISFALEHSDYVPATQNYSGIAYSGHLHSEIGRDNDKSDSKNNTEEDINAVANPTNKRDYEFDSQVDNLDKASEEQRLPATSPSNLTRVSVSSAIIPLNSHHVPTDIQAGVLPLMQRPGSKSTMFGVSSSLSSPPLSTPTKSKATLSQKNAKLSHDVDNVIHTSSSSRATPLVVRSPTSRGKSMNIVDTRGPRTPSSNDTNIAPTSSLSRQLSRTSAIQETRTISHNIPSAISRSSSRPTSRNQDFTYTLSASRLQSQKVSSDLNQPQDVVPSRESQRSVSRQVTSPISRTSSRQRPSSQHLKVQSQTPPHLRSTSQSRASYEMTLPSISGLSSQGTRRPTTRGTSPTPLSPPSSPTRFQSSSAPAVVIPPSSPGSFGYSGHSSGPRMVVSSKPTSPLPRVAMLTSPSHIKAYERALLQSSLSPLYPQSPSSTGVLSMSGFSPTSANFTRTSPHPRRSLKVSSPLPRVAQMTVKLHEKKVLARTQTMISREHPVIPLESALSLRDNKRYVFEDQDGTLSVHKILLRLQQYIQEIALLKLRDVDPLSSDGTSQSTSSESISDVGDEFGRLGWATPADSSSAKLPRAQFAVLVLSGTLAPVNEGHVAALACAKVALERDYGYTVLCAYLAPASDAHMRLKVLKKEHHMPLEHRVKMCEIATEDSPYIDVCEYGWASPDRVAEKIRSVMRSIVFSLPDVREVLDEHATFDVVQICGTNTALKNRLYLRGNYLAISRAGSAEKLSKDVMMARSKQEPDGPAHRFLILEPEYEDNDLPDVQETDSTKLREMLLTSARPRVREVEEMGWLHINVLKYIVQGLDRFGWLCHK